MKREFYEISDDEWENHNFKPSRVLKRQRPSPSPPPIESFGYTSRNNNLEISGHTGNGGGDDDDDDDDDDCVEITRNSAGFPDHLDDLEDADVDDNNSAAAAAPNRGRRFIIDDDDEDEEDSDRDGGRQKDVAELYEIGSSSSEEEVEEEEGEGDESDVVGRALHKCAKISAELKGELFGSSGTACERYSEVESSSVRIVTQVCGVQKKNWPIRFQFFFLG